jgi:mRNA degradation ribonuclease J1/J2
MLLKIFSIPTSNKCTEEYITCKQNFLLPIRREKCVGVRVKSIGSHVRFRFFENSKKFNIDSIEVKALDVDHLIPGVCGFILHTSNGSWLYWRSSLPW